MIHTGWLTVVWKALHQYTYLQDFPSFIVIWKLLNVVDLRTTSIILWVVSSIGH